MRILAAILALLFLCLALPAQAQTTYFPAQGVFNGYLNQLNIIECDNTGADAVDLSLDIKLNNGNEILTNYPVRIEAFGSRHTIINGLVNITDSFGIYKLKIAPGQELRGDRLNCRTAFYRNAKPNRGKTFDYAYTLPVENPSFGTLGGVYNSMNPSPTGGSPTLNWLSIVNFDANAFSATVEVYDGNGSLIDNIAITNLPSGGRKDIPLGHNRGQVTGVYRIFPTDDKQLYDAFLVRYGPDSSNGFNFAFALKSHIGACEGTPLLASTMGNGKTDNWLEIANITSEATTVTVDVRNRNGQSVYNQNHTVSPFAQQHVFLSPLIDPSRSGNVGSARVTCADPSDKLLIQTAFYGKLNNNPKIEWSYARQLRGNSVVNSGAQLLTPLNTFVKMANWVKVADSAGTNSTLSFEVFSPFGALVASGSDSLASGGTVDIGAHSMVGGDFVGAMLTSSNDESAFTGELLRVLSTNTGEIGNIINIPGIVQQQGVSGSSLPGFFGNPQSLAPYRDKLTKEEIRHLFTRAAFGTTPEEFSFANSNGLKASVEKLTTLVNDSTVLNTALSLARTTDSLGNASYSYYGVKNYWLYLMANSPNPLKEKLAFFWHDLFAASCNSDIGQEKDHCFKHLELLRSEAFGNYRRLLKAIAKDPVILFWLNGRVNGKTAPDENYAREHWELFSMGEKSKHRGRYPLYTEKDIAEAAKAFTGCWTETAGNLVTGNCPTPTNWSSMPTSARNRRDNSVKTLWQGTPYQISGNFYPDDITNLTLSRRPEAAQFLAKRLFVTFIHDHPSMEIVNQIADTLRRNNWDVIPVVKILLRSEAMFSSEARKNRLKDPITFMIGIQRATGLRMNTWKFNQVMTLSGLELLNPPDVNGWPMSKPGEDAKSIYYLGWPETYQNYIPDLLQFPETGANIVSKLRARFSTANPSAEQVVDQLAELLDVQLSESERNNLIFYMNNQRNTAGSSSTYTQKTFNAAVGTSGDRFIRTKVGGLLWILSTNDNFLMF